MDVQSLLSRKLGGEDAEDVGVGFPRVDRDRLVLSRLDSELQLTSQYSLLDVLR